MRSVLYADAETKGKIRQEQLKIAEDINHSAFPFPVDEWYLTPYGPPSPTVSSLTTLSSHSLSLQAYVVTIPNEYVGLIIGKGGETI